MKNTKRVIAFMLVLFTLIPLAVSCTTDKPGNGDNESSNGNVSESETGCGVLPIVGEGFATVYSNGEFNFTAIKYPVGKNEVLIAAINRLRERLKKETNETIKVTPDYSSDKNPPDSSTYEILIGNTNYPESKEALSEIATGDYIIKVIGNKLVINARSDDELNRAILYILNTMFESTITEKDGQKTIVINDYKYTKQRNLDDIRIDGKSIKEYSIVYKTGNDEAENKTSANILFDAFANRAGIILPVISDKEECKTAHKIVIGTELSELGKISAMKYMSKIKDGNYYISAGGALSLSMGVTDIDRTYLTKATNRVSTLGEIEKNLGKVESQPLTAGAEFRVMTYNIMAQWEGWGGDYMPVSKRFEGFKYVMDTYSPDVVGLQEVSEQWSKIIAERYTEYAFVHQRTPDNKYYNLSTIIYKKDKFNVIDKGLQYFRYNGPNQIRLVNWVVLEDKATSKQFVFFNTHWMYNVAETGDAERKDHSIENAIIINKVMADHPNAKYCFSTADYNTTLTHEYTIDFLKNANLVNTLDIAKASGNLINEVGGCGTLGVSRENNSGGGSIDNIFATNNMQVLRHETILWGGIEHVSDHSPKYADIKLGE